MSQASADLLMEDLGHGNRLLEDCIAKTKASYSHISVSVCFIYQNLKVNRTYTTASSFSRK